MSFPVPGEEFLRYNESEKLKIILVTRIVCIIGLISFIFLFFVYCKRRKNFIIFMIINSQM